MRIDLPDGETISAFVDKRDVTVERGPEPGKVVLGRVRVRVVEFKKNAETALVDLPQPAITKGPRLEVPKEFLEHG
ncbi:MAG: hypothetical protein ACE5JJ_04315 [Nitrospinota bacterium]